MRRRATHEGAESAPPPDFEEKLRQFERRRGANHIQLFLEQVRPSSAPVLRRAAQSGPCPQAISEIMEGGGATKTIQRLTHVRRLLDDVLAQVQQLTQKMSRTGGGRDITAMTR